MLHTISNECLKVTVAEDGAELQSIWGIDGTEYLWQGDKAYWKSRALNIFPYVARLTDGSYYLDGELHRMDIHGIAPYAHFTAVESSDTRLALELSADDRTLAVYPRHFVFRVIYTLRKDSLEITYEVENRDQRPMYFGLGGHPGFNVPMEDGLTFEDYRLRFDRLCQPKRIGFTETCFRNGKDEDYPLVDNQCIPLRHDLFDHDAVVLKDVSHQVTLEAPGHSRCVTVSFPQMDYVGFWHRPKTDAPFVCIEPWCSLPAMDGGITVFEDQPDLLRLAPDTTYRNCWTITINI